jgi:hypothetical protein
LLGANALKLAIQIHPRFRWTRKTGLQCILAIVNVLADNLPDIVNVGPALPTSVQMTRDARSIAGPQFTIAEPQQILFVRMRAPPKHAEPSLIV